MRILRFLTLSTSLLLLTSFLAGPTAADEVRVPVANDLQAEAIQAEDRKLPILVLFSSSYCGYCTIVREDFLEPMLKSGDYKDKVIIRMISIDGSDDLRDFDGKQVDPEIFADNRGVFVTPTVKFFGPDGNETSQDLVGLMTVDYYGGYIDAAIEESLAQLRNGKQKLAQTK